MPAPTPPQPERQHWALDLKVNVGHILATLGLAAGLFTWGSAIDRRLAVLEEKASMQASIDTKQDSASQAATLLLRADLAGMKAEISETNRKLDRLIESLPRGR